MLNLTHGMMNIRGRVRGKQSGRDPQGLKLLGFRMSGTPKNGDRNPNLGPGFPIRNPRIARLTDSLKLGFSDRGRAGQGRAGQGRAGQGRAGAGQGQGRAGE